MNQFTPARLDRDEGYRVLNVLQDEATQQAALPDLEQLTPGFPDWIVTTLFGGTYQREGLSLRDRQLINLGALTALRRRIERELGSDVASAILVGNPARAFAANWPRS